MLRVPKKVLQRAAIGALACGLLMPVLPRSLAAQQDSDMTSRMILELQQMREEVRELRGMVEAQAQEIENLKRRQRDQYLDLDRRIGELQNSGVAQPSQTRDHGRNNGRDDTQQEARRADEDRRGDEPAGRGDQNADAGRGTSSPAGGDLPEVREPLVQQPRVEPLADPGTGQERELREPTEAEQQAYDQAFRALRETRYADAAEAFDRFLRDYPDSEYAPNALYWLGEVYYVTRDFETALAQFERLQETYPESGKQPDALLKIGFSHYELGQWERARAALEQVISDYPGTNYSRLAENRLRTMRLEGHL